MAHDYHGNRERYFEHQYRVTAEYVIPFILQSGPLPTHPRVLEIGCGEAGVLKAFLELGATTVGVDLSAARLARGATLLSDAVKSGQATLLNMDAHELDAKPEFAGYFDLIVLKDVIEHVDDRPSLFALMARLLRPDGRVFFSFPPWQMPFGGHQQVCKSWLLSRTPYFHLLPTSLYRSVLSAFSEKPTRVESLLATKRTGLGSLEFEALLQSSGYRILNERLYLLNPMYSYRFGVRPLEQAHWVADRKILRDFVTTCVYCTAQPRATPAPSS